VSAADPIWWRDAGLPSWPEAPRRARERVVVVGAGLAGLGVARALRERGVDALVVDREGPASGASGRNAGFVLRTHVTEYPSLRARVGAEVARAMLSLAAENAAQVTALAPEIARRGSLMLAAGEKELEALDVAARALAEDGVAVERTEVPAALAGFDAALRVDGDGDLHPGKLVAALAEGTRGARMRVSRIAGTVLHDTEGRAIEADAVVLATNAWTRELVPPLSDVITPHRAQMIATAPLPRALPLPCYAGLGFDYFRQREDGRVLLGGRRHLFFADEASADVRTTEGVQSALEAYLRAHLPFARGAAVEARWAGTMGFSRDGLPLVGALPGAPGHYLIGGFTGHGLGLALALGARLAAEITGEVPNDLLARTFAPARFSAMFAQR
jgi:glycine/D-amino acid oxidase-like deaminating enzyme